MQIEKILAQPDFDIIVLVLFFCHRFKFQLVCALHCYPFCTLHIPTGAWPWAQSKTLCSNYLPAGLQCSQSNTPETCISKGFQGLNKNIYFLIFPNSIVEYCFSSPFAIPSKKALGPHIAGGKYLFRSSLLYDHAVSHKDDPV